MIFVIPFSYIKVQPLCIVKHAFSMGYCSAYETENTSLFSVVKIGSTLPPPPSPLLLLANIDEAYSLYIARRKTKRQRSGGGGWSQ
jgi:hypothetical protein